jgi:hypothetical protein
MRAVIAGGIGVLARIIIQGLAALPPRARPIAAAPAPVLALRTGKQWLQEPVL